MDRDWEREYHEAKLENEESETFAERRLRDQFQTLEQQHGRHYHFAFVLHKYREALFFYSQMKTAANLQTFRFYTSATLAASRAFLGPCQ